MSSSANEAWIYQIKITLERIKPPIWRRVLVPSDISLGVLHEVIQESMGWIDEHLHEFSVGRQSYGPADADLATEASDERGVALDALLKKKGDALRYIYDFGDDWLHTITLEAIHTNGDAAVPTCIDGKRACPPEDCGGPPGYDDIVAAVRKPKSAKNADLLDWVGDDYDPEHFDLAAVNDSLARFVAKPQQKKSRTTKPPAPPPAQTIAVDEERIDDMVLALLSLTIFKDKTGTRAWKNFDWDSLNRLHAKGYLHDPVGTAKSVLMTAEGEARAVELFTRLFAKR